MENEFLEVATRTVLAMASALLLHHCEIFNRLQERPHQAERVPYRNAQSESRAAPPMSDSYIDQLGASRTMHFNESEPSQRSQRSVSHQQRGRPQDSYSDLYQSRTIHIPDDSVQQESSLDQSQPEESYRVIRSSRPVPRRRIEHRNPDRSYLPIPSPRVGYLPSFRFSPGTEQNDHLPGFYRPGEPIIAPIGLPRSSFPDRNQTTSERREIDTSRYRSFMAGRMPPLRSPDLYYSPRAVMSPVSNLDSESFPNVSTAADESQLDETINTLMNRINRQAAIIQAGWQPTERLRIGIMRRNSDDYDPETGRMRSLEEFE